MVNDRPESAQLRQFTPKIHSASANQLNLALLPHSPTGTMFAPLLTLT